MSIYTFISVFSSFKLIIVNSIYQSYLSWLRRQPTEYAGGCGAVSVGGFLVVTDGISARLMFALIALSLINRASFPMLRFLRTSVCMCVVFLPTGARSQAGAPPAFASLSALILYEAGRSRFGRTPVIDRDSARRVLVAAAGVRESRAFDLLSREHPALVHGMPRRGARYTFGADTTMIVLTDYTARAASSGVVELTRIEHDKSGAEARLRCLLAVRRTPEGLWSRDAFAGGSGGLVCLVQGASPKR